MQIRLRNRNLRDRRLYDAGANICRQVVNLTGVAHVPAWLYRMLGNGMRSRATAEFVGTSI